jgi:sensor histidine kinase YesM
MLSTSKKRKLLKTALVLSPLMGLVSVIPIILFVSSVPFVDVEFILSPVRILGALVFISCAQYIQWVLNIWLYGLPISQNNVRLLFSFLLSFLIISTFVAIRNFVIDFDFDPEGIYVFKYYPFVGYLANNVFVLILIDLLVTRERRDELELERANFERNSLQLKLDQIKHRIHPHFLFNALGNLRVLIGTNPDLAKEYVSGISTFLRDSLKDSSKEVVSVKDELKLLENYIKLQKIRFGDSIELHSNLPSSVVEGEHLPAFTFQLLAENAIKHNGFSKTKPLVLTLNYFEQKNMILFENTLLPKKPLNDSTGFGELNLQERFEMLKSKPPIFKKNVSSMTYSVQIFPLQS